MVAKLMSKATQQWLTKHNDRLLRERVLGLIKQHDPSGGIRFETLLATVVCTEEELEQVLIDLLSEGRIYEPQILVYRWG